MAPPPTPAPTGQPEQDRPDESLGGLVRDYGARVRGGDVGALPAVLGLVALVIVFTILRPETFTNAFNFANLINQSAAVMVIAMGLVFVLLLGEIDLSAGYTAGTAACFMGIVLTRHGWPWFPSLLVCLGYRRRDRRLHRPARRPARHPVVRGHARGLPRPPGRDARAHRRGRHDPLPRRHDPRGHEQEPPGLAGLDALPSSASRPTPA